MLHPNLSPEVPFELPLPLQHNTDNIQCHTQLHSCLPSQLQDSATCPLSQINPLYSSPKLISHLLRCPPQLGRLDRATLPLELYLMSHLQRLERLYVSHESLFRKPWAEGEVACRHSALGCDLRSCVEKIWAQTPGEPKE